MDFISVKLYGRCEKQVCPFSYFAERGEKLGYPLSYIAYQGEKLIYPISYTVN